MGTTGSIFLAEMAARFPGDDAIDAAERDEAEAIDGIIEGAHSEGALAWTPVSLAVDRYARQLAARLEPPAAGASIAATLASLHLVDFYLAFAAGLGLKEAQALFIERYLAPIEGAVSSIDASPGFVDDVRQALHVRLLLLPEGSPKILQYGGRASLASWVAVSARRAALELVRDGAAHRKAVERAAEEPVNLDLDPELQFLKTRYRAAFKAAVTEAIARLPSRERTILRLHAVGGLTLARIAAMFSVDESTVCRWEKRAREVILAETHRELGLQLDLRVNELPSLARLVTSQLDVSVARLLADDAPQGEAGSQGVEGIGS